MFIEHREDNKGGIFYISGEGSPIAELTYKKPEDNHLLIEHVEVNPQHRQQGIGEKMVRAAAEYARKKQLKVTPRCYFARVVMRENEDLQDVLNG